MKAASILTVLPNEASFVAAAKIDPAAFAVIYDHYYTPVYNYVHYRVMERTQTEDVTAQIFEKVLGSLHRYDAGQGTFAVWLFTIARNSVGDHLRKLRRRRWLSLENVQEQASEAPQPEEYAIRQEEHEQLWQALATLGDRDRDLLALKFAAQLTNRRIAELTELSEANVAVILFRALKRLRIKLQADAKDNAKDNG
jgi:RNA polymerase sigma-70 factor, ECF subfamily